jgi:molecular chaperone GrpE
MSDPENQTPDEGQLEVEVETPAAGDEGADAGLKVKGQLAALAKDRQEIYDRLLRTAADFDNFRKRARKDQEEARLKAREEILKEILPGIDNLERALAATGASTEAVVSGVRMVVRQFTTASPADSIGGKS